jgi:hypothetical protein
LQKIFRQLERINPNAARSLEEGLQETLTVHRLGVGAVLRRNWHHQPDRILSVDGAAGGAKRKALAKEISRCAGPPPDSWKQRKSSDASKDFKKSCC